MTDNEKRAHDLAIVSMNYQQADIVNGKEERFDIYATYKNLYFQLLESCNRDFPDGR